MGAELRAFNRQICHLQVIGRLVRHKNINRCSWVLSSLLVLGAEAHAAAGWTNASTITAVNQQPTVGAGAELVFIETDATANPSSCTDRTTFYFSVADDRRKRLFAMLIAAQLAGKTVQIYTTGTCHSTWGASELDGVVVR